MTKKPKTTKHGTVKKNHQVSRPSVQKGQKSKFTRRTKLYKEIRIENALEDERGKKVKLKKMPL